MRLFRLTVKENKSVQWLNLELVESMIFDYENNFLKLNLASGSNWRLEGIDAVRLAQHLYDTPGGDLPDE